MKFILSFSTWAAVGRLCGDCHARWISAKFMGYLLDGAGKFLFQASQPRPDVAWRQPVDLRHFRVTHPVEVQQNERTIDGRQLTNRGINELQSLAFTARGRDGYR